MLPACSGNMLESKPSSTGTHPHDDGSAGGADAGGPKTPAGLHWQHLGIPERHEEDHRRRPAVVGGEVQLQGFTNYGFRARKTPTQDHMRHVAPTKQACRTSLQGLTRAAATCGSRPAHSTLLCLTVGCTLPGRHYLRSVQGGGWGVIHAEPPGQPASGQHVASRQPAAA